MSRPIHPICVKCKKEYRPKKNGVFVELMADFGSYEIFHADLVECPKCGHQIITGFGQGPVGNHLEEDYKELLGKIGKTYKCY